MSLFLLDSDCIIDILKGLPSTAALIERLFDQGQTLAVSDVVLAEVWSGLHPDVQTAAIRFLSSLAFLPTTAEAARQAGEWRYAFARKVQALSTKDCLIAATAVHHDASVVTGNLRHYPMQEVRITPLSRPESRQR